MLVRLQSPQVVAMLKGSTKVIICLDEKENKLHHDHVMFIKDLIQPTVSELVLCCEFWGSFQFPFNLLECCHQLETFTIMGDVFDSDDDQTLEVEECQLKFFNRLCKQLEQLPEFKLLVSHRVVNDVARCDVFDFTPDAAPLQSPPDQWETQQWEQTVVVENEMKQCQHTILTHQINEQIIGIDLSAKWKFPFWEERRKHWQTLDDLVRAAPPLKLTRQNACCL